tara:strand:- start:91 stop:756 length:666 start_codon:yes stop_codon:yes gene_type:complete
MKTENSALISQFEEFKNGENYVITREEFTNILSTSKNLKTKKKMCSYFVWLNQNRKFIQNEYFSDFYDVEDWSIDKKKQYYISKGLSTEKINKDGRPRIASLITTKAGILWKELDVTEKKKFEEISKEQNISHEIVEVEEVPKEKKKRGRPRKNKEHKNVSDAVIENCNQKSSDSNNDEIKVEEIVFQGKTYYLDIKTFDIYDPDTEEVVGKKNGTNIYIN